MKTLILKVQVPEWFSIETCMVNLELYNEDQFKEYDQTEIKVITPPTDEEIEQAEETHYSTGIWLRDKIFGE